MNVLATMVEKEKKQYYYKNRVDRTPVQKILPELTLTSPKNENTKNGEWGLQSEGQQLKVFAFLKALKEFQEEADMGKEQFEGTVTKMVAAAGEIRVSIMAWEVEEAFIGDWQAGDDVDHDQQMKSNQIFTNRVKKLWRAEMIVKVKNGLGTVEPQDIVAYYVELEKTEKIHTSLKKNRITSADEVKRALKCGEFLKKHHLFQQYAKLEFVPDLGQTPMVK